MSPFQCSHTRIDDLWNCVCEQQRQCGRAARVTRTEPPWLARQPPEPFEAVALRELWCAHLCAGDEVERSADAEEAGAADPIDAASGKNFLLW